MKLFGGFCREKVRASIGYGRDRLLLCVCSVFFDVGLSFH